MSKVSQSERDNLPDSAFAVPGKHKLLITDERHTRLAWDMVDRTDGLTSQERTEARERIKRRAHELGIDTSDWKTDVHASQLGEVSVENHDVAKTSIICASSASNVLLGELEHPNKLPFTGVLTWFDVPSDLAPNGSGGKRVVIPSEVGVPALDSLVGMAVNYQPTLDKHAPRQKVGVITSYSVGEPQEDGGRPVHISGYVYALDFEDAAVDIKLNQDILGFSYETAESVIETGIWNGEPVAIVTELGYFTGAAILMKSKAAYQNTSLAASSGASADQDQEGNDLDFEKLMASLDEMRSHMHASFEALLAAVSNNGNGGEVAASSDPDHDGDDDSTASGATDGDATGGQGGEVHANADDTTTATDDTNAADTSSDGADTTSVQASADTVDVSAVLAENEALKAQVASLQASVVPPARDSFAHPTMLAAQHEAKPEGEYERLMASIEADKTLSPEQKFAKVFELRQRLTETAK